MAYCNIEVSFRKYLQNFTLETSKLEFESLNFGGQNFIAYTVTTSCNILNGFQERCMMVSVFG